MVNIQKYEPLWGSWYVESLIGEGTFSKVYRIHREILGQVYYAAAKSIAIPHDESDLQLMQREGLDDVAMLKFLQALTKNIILEIELMSEFRGNKHIVSFEDYQILEEKDAIGWVILIRMELLTSLADFVERISLPEAEVVKVGIHMCRALELCAQKKIIHRDIKPENIFVSAQGDYKLGDFGIARQIESTTSGLSKKGTNSYMAPEVFKFESYSAGADIYSLGMVLYSLLNRNRTPFLPDFPHPIMPGDREEALRRRMSGEVLPLLKGVSPAMASLVLRACAYNRQDRFASPAEMRGYLETIV
jgi:serine/threonine-protein kinase